jgi:hypothetical protein
MMKSVVPKAPIIRTKVIVFVSIVLPLSVLSDDIAT